MIYCLKICFFSSVVYPETYILSNLSNKGGKIVSNELAVQIKRTFDKSISISTYSSLNLKFWIGSNTYIITSWRLAPPALDWILSI